MNLGALSPPAGLLQALLLCAFMAFGVNKTGPAQAQQRPNSCWGLAEAEKSLREESGEFPMIEWDLSDDPAIDRGIARIYGNTRTGTTTVLLIIHERDTDQKIACLLGTGHRMRIAPQFKPAEMPL